MRPLLRAALIVAALGGLVRIAGGLVARAPRPTSATATAATTGAASAPCPPHTLPDQGACVPVPPPPPALGAPLARDLDAGPDNHIPLLPGRPEDPTRYRWPLPLAARGPIPSPRERPSSPTVAVELAGNPGQEVHLLHLEHQVGDAEILWVGELLGPTVVTLHALRGTEGLRSLLLFHGGLGAPTMGLARGANLRPGAPLGSLAPTGSALFFEIREARRGVDVKALAAAELRQFARTIPVDPRNVLPLAP